MLTAPSKSPSPSKSASTISVGVTNGLQDELTADGVNNPLPFGAAAVNDQSSGEWWGDAPEFAYDYFRRTSARLMAAQGMTQAAIAQELGVTDRTVRAWLRE